MTSLSVYESPTGEIPAVINQDGLLNSAGEFEPGTGMRMVLPWQWQHSTGNLRDVFPSPKQSQGLYRFGVVSCIAGMLA